MSAGLSSLPTTLDSTTSADCRNNTSRQVTVLSVLSVVICLLAIGLLIVWRRFVGALDENLPRNAMVLAAVVSTAAMACSRLAWRRHFPLQQARLANRSRRKLLAERLVGYGSSAALLLLAVGCCFPTSSTSDWLIWLPLLVADQFWRQSFFDAGDPAKGLRVLSAENDVEEVSSTLAFSGAGGDLECGATKSSNGDLEIARGEQIVQQLFRVRDECSREVIYGTVRADFQAGQRTAVVHVGFCPPLLHRPEIEAESIPGSAAQIKVVQAFTHGTRMDVRLPSAAESDCHIWIDMAATPVMPDRRVQA